ncbi:MAG: GntR family transcriptional regulator [Lachnospiraceae bacterium]|nr:GntR family transcriptional regulator [Lachnospiraceae bacterium]
MNDTKVYLLVIDHIKSLFQQGKLTFGGKLPSERQLMATLGLSRNSVREALRSLENMGIIESRHGQGTFLVNHIGNSLGSIFSLLLFMNECSEAEVNELRQSIEIGAYLIAVSQADDDQLRALNLCLDQLKHSSAEERAAIDKQFHDTLIQMSGNRLLILLRETLSPLFENTIQEKLTHISSEEWKTLLVHHEHICTCLTAREKASGIRAIVEHYDFIDSVC